MAETLDWHAKRDPDRLAVVCGDDEVTRLELERASNRAGRVFAEMGVQPGDLVTIALPNGVAFYVAAFGALKLGATPMPVSHRLPRKERESIIALGRTRNRDRRVSGGVQPSSHLAARLASAVAGR